ncbi:dihydrolipoyl dehydrogenase [Candidatus Legionella polyplacis]|uniref:dihydrolipoyl dehydrogenase n=1 Tax=Candidatus Legionella polyplacis TaxID=2005262 RepID=UPI000C1E0B58|nr:dihydrolipoyl dehydrogenase [Candidatus Legionella polyplacis]ATW01664.1 dihydrolipoyl dehydrogenase [Candidatus Legionella polyplacis]
MNVVNTEVVVIGGGPGGYTSAFRSADLGKKVVLVEKFFDLGGTCLNVGCIPSKILLNISNIIFQTNNISTMGVTFEKPKINIEQILSHKNYVVNKLRNGIKFLAKKRNIQIFNGLAEFVTPNNIVIQDKYNNKNLSIKFQYAVIATGSYPLSLPNIPKDSRIFNSTQALNLPNIYGNLLIVGGGVIGLEMATIYSSFGVEVTIIDCSDCIIPESDTDLSSILQNCMTEDRKIKFILNSNLISIETKTDGICVLLKNKISNKENILYFDQILIAIGRKPNTNNLKIKEIDIKTDINGFIITDNQMRTNISNIFAIGDVIGKPMLAHKAIAEGKIAAEVISGLKHYFDPYCIPNVAYTSPEISWVGLTEKQAKKENISYEVANFPWKINGRALTLNKMKGLTKLIFCTKTNRILGGGIIGYNSEELISELTLAIEMGCNVSDISLTIHPHPTLSETIMASSEIFEKKSIDYFE